MKKPMFSAAAAVFTCLSLATSLAFAEKPARKSFGRGNPFTAEELPTGKLKAKLQTLNPKAKEKAMKWLHGFNFESFDAAEHLRVDNDGGVFIVCPDGHGNCNGHEHGAAAPKEKSEGAGAIPAITTPASDRSLALPPTANAPVLVSNPPAYNSKPGAPNHIYLDFNGGIVTGKAWNSSSGVASYNCKAWDKDGDRTTFNDAEQAEIRRIWERTAEDYAPFDVNVTTSASFDPDTYTGDKNKVAWSMFTPTVDNNNVNLPHHGYGGIAYVNVFGASNYHSSYQPAFTIDYDSANATEAGTHEVGHNMGLSHDGTSTLGYYGGHAGTASAPSWGPIMGTGYGQNVTQWSKGEYFNSNQAQDDLVIISGKLGYRTDDHGDSFGAATVWLSSTVNQQGIVERTNNADYFGFTTGAGTISFNASTYKCDTSTWGGNLDIQLELYNSSGTLISSSNPAADVTASISQSVAAGEYYVVLKPSAAGTPTVASPSGYTAYGSLGQYRITGNFIPTASISLTAPNGGENWSTNTAQNISWASGMGGNVKIELLKNGILDSTIIASTPNDGSYSWSIPSNQILATNYRMRITSVETPAQSDTSLSDFTIMTLPTLADALDTSGLTWTSSGNANWSPQSTTTHDGIDAAQSGAITNDQTSSMAATLVGPGTLTFWWKVSSESGFDYLRFYLNEVQQASAVQISGNVDWVQKTISIPAGSQTIKWTYSKDDSVDTGSDTAWVDQVVYSPSGTPEINLTGNGTSIDDGDTTPSLTDHSDFGSVAFIGGTLVRTFTIQNTGTAALAVSNISNTLQADFTLGALTPASPIPAGGSATFTVTFDPSASGQRTATLSIVNDDANENPYNFDISGTGIAPAEIAVEQPLLTDVPDNTSKSFGNVMLGSSTSLEFTIKNTGGSDLTGLTITKDGANAGAFTVTQNPVSLVPAGGSTTFIVRFAPSVTTGARTAAIHIASNDSDENPFDITLTGTGITGLPEIAVEQPLLTNIPDNTSKSFGDVMLGSSTSLEFTIKNTGGSDLTGLTITKDGANAAAFTVTKNPGSTVPAGGSTTFIVRFAPSVTTGARTAAIHIASNDSDENPFDITLTGTGITGPPEIAVEQPLLTNIPDNTSRSFGNVVVGSSTSLEFTIKNTGGAPLTGLTVTKDGANAGAFSVTKNPGSPVPAGASTTFIVRFAPNVSTGPRTAAIHIASNDSDENPFDITLTGTGIASPSPISMAQLPAWGDIKTSDIFPGIVDEETSYLDRPKTITSVEQIGGRKYLSLAVAKSPGKLDIRRIVQVSPNLIDWYSGRNHTTVMQNDATILKVRDNTPITPEAKRYIRLK